MAGKGAAGPLLAVGAVGGVFVLAFAMVILAVVATPPAGACGSAGATPGGGAGALAGGGGVVGASEYGGPADPTSGITGAYGLLPGHYAFAELSTNPNAGLAALDFKALGGLPPHTLLQVTYNGKTLIAEKLDVGAGGGLVGGHPRVIDLWYQTAQALGFTGTGLVQIAPAPAGTPESAALVGGAAPGTPGAPPAPAPGTCPAGTGGPQQVAATPGSYYNPLRGIAGLAPERIDQGVDYAGSGPLYAIGDGVVLSTTNSGWPGGAFIAIRLTDGPATGAVVYEAENITPIQVTVGQTVTANTVLGQLVNASPHLEIGWGNPGSLGSSLSQSYGGFHDGASTALGLNFNQLLIKLGAPAGLTYPPMGSLPAGWPAW